MLCVGKFRKEFRRTIACRCRWLSGYFPSLSSSSGADSNMSNYALTVAGGAGFRSTGVNNPHHHHNRPPSTMTTAFGTTALISAAPTSAAVAGLSVITSSAAVYPLRQCRSQYRPVAAANRSSAGANSVLSTRCTISNSQFGSTAPSWITAFSQKHTHKSQYHTSRHKCFVSFIKNNKFYYHI